MIKIDKRHTDLPEILTSPRAIDSINSVEHKALQGTLRSEDFDREIYGCKDVKGKLREDQHGKCAYCETKLTGDFGAVEHYRPKTKYIAEDGTRQLGYYWLAYDWENLLCSCDKCNSAARKGNLFPLRDPSARDIANKDISKEVPLLINPAMEDPQEHIGFHKYVAFAVSSDGVESDKGRCTIDVFDLNAKAENCPNKELLEERKRLWRKVEMLVDLCMSNGDSRDAAIERVMEFYGNDDDEYLGMIRNQHLWP